MPKGYRMRIYHGHPSQLRVSKARVSMHALRSTRAAVKFCDLT